METNTKKIVEKAKKEIIIIDNYVSKDLLKKISTIDKNIIIVTKNMNIELIEKYQKQYNNLKIIQSQEFHDRFIVIDRKKLYSCGASLKDLGKGCFAINEIRSSEIIQNILKKIF